jgi:hypothetical protein
MESYEHNMSNDGGEEVSFVRLFEAAEAILHAESALGTGSVTMWRDGLAPAQGGFSAHELMEALFFLRRLGLVEQRDASTTTPRRRHRK